MLCRNAAKWFFRLDEDLRWNSGIPFPEDAAFDDRQGKRRLEVRTSGEIRVLRDYAWDGCTPKLCLLDIVVGIPDGVVHAGKGRPKTYYASLVHDALYQFLPEIPLERRLADQCFLELMTETHFAWRYPYYWAVRLFGEVFRRIGRRFRNTAGKKVPL